MQTFVLFLAILLGASRAIDGDSPNAPARHYKKSHKRETRQE